jgi:hypothetical protein
MVLGLVDEFDGIMNIVCGETKLETGLGVARL